MSYQVGSFTQPGVGLATINVGFQPTGLRFAISQTAGTLENTVAHLSVGFTDGVNQFAHSMYSNDISDAFTRINDAFCLTHYAVVGGAFKRVISASFVGFTANGFTLDFDRASGAYLITFEAFN